jgi:arsenate reductase
MRVTVYHYPACSTCRKAMAWLRERDIEVDAIDIVAAPPSATELERIANLADCPPAKMFNVSGQSYRAGGFKDRVPSMSAEQMFEALSADGKVIKRPLVVGDDLAIVGFDPDLYRIRLAQ